MHKERCSDVQRSQNTHTRSSLVVCKWIWQVVVQMEQAKLEQSLSV